MFLFSSYDAALVRLHQTYQVLQQDGLARSARADDHVAHARLILHTDVLEQSC